MCLKMYFNVQATTVLLHFELTEPWCFHHRNVWSWWACLQTRVSCYKHGGELWRLTWGKWKIVYLADNQWSYYVWSKKPNFFLIASLWLLLYTNNSFQIYRHCMQVWGCNTRWIYILAYSSITEIMDQLPGEEWLLGNRTDSKLITSKIAYLGNNSLL